MKNKTKASIEQTNKFKTTLEEYTQRIAHIKRRNRKKK